MSDDDRLNVPHALMIVAGFMLLWAVLVMAIDHASGGVW